MKSNELSRLTVLAEIREMRGRMWTSVSERKHTVTKVFPAQFGDASAPGEVPKCEWMLFGEVQIKNDDGTIVKTPWAGHGVVRKEKVGEKEEWKFARYQVWLQK